jgi:hypothetical protein
LMKPSIKIIETTARPSQYMDNAMHAFERGRWEDSKCCYRKVDVSDI